MFVNLFMMYFAHFVLILLVITLQIVSDFDYCKKEGWYPGMVISRRQYWHDILSAVQIHYKVNFTSLRLFECVNCWYKVF